MKNSGHRCSGCRHHVSRRNFLKMTAGAGLSLTALNPLVAAPDKAEKVRVGLVHVCAPQDWNLWPHVNFDYAKRKGEVEQALGKSCPGIEFVPITLLGNPDEEIGKVKNLAGEVDGLLVFLYCTNWGLTGRLLPAIGEWKKPTVFVDELYAGSGVFLCHGARTIRNGAKVVLLSTGRFQDVVDVTRCFEGLGEPGASLKTFVARAETVRKGNFAIPGDLRCKDDPVTVAEVGEVIKRLEDTKILRVISRKGDPYKALGATVEPVSFDEINAAYQKVDREEADRWAKRWMQEAAEVVEPTREDIRSSAAIYLAMKDLLQAKGAQAITVDCLGGFYSGKLPGYPCLGYRQLNDDGATAGTCEAQIPDMLAMLISRYLFGRASFASDPVLDTSVNQVIYAHCVAPTKMLGPDGGANPFKIRSHAEDDKGASIQSIMPLQYMTTSFRMAHDSKSMVIHQGKAVANVDEPKACRTKLAVEVKGDIDKLFREWDRYSWHRLTVYGDVQGPIEEVAKAFKMKVIHEA